MFVLTDKNTGGVYAVKNYKNVQTVQAFVKKDDAVRYYELLKADNYKTDLDIIEVDPQVLALNCETRGLFLLTSYPDELIIPPSDDYI